MKKFSALLLCVVYLFERAIGSGYWPVPPADIIGGYRRSAKHLQAGVMARVYKGVNIATREIVAIRIVRRLKQNKRLENMIKYEKILQSKLRNDNVLGLIDFFEEELFYYFITEFADGGDVFDRLVAEPGDYGFSEELAKSYFKQMIAGLEYLHGLGIIHRDLKLENVLVKNFNTGGNPIVMIADFGFSIKLDSPNNELIKDNFLSIEPENGLAVSKIDRVVGTPWYVSPDVYVDWKYTYGSDVYALGMMLFVMLTKQFPNETEYSRLPIAEDLIRSKLTAANASGLVQDLLVEMLRPNRADRINLAHVKSHPWVADSVETLTRSITPHSNKENEGSQIDESPAPIDTDKKFAPSLGHQITHYEEWV